MLSFARLLSLLALAVPFLLSGCTTMNPVPPAAVAEFAPTGTLRVAINYGNAVLAARDAATGELSGVSVDLARELARRLGVPVAFTGFNTAGRVVDAVKTGTLDVMFLAIDPLRANEIDYSAAYVLIEGAYAVPQASPIRANAEVDRAGVRVVVGAGSAYDLHLTRELKAATIVRVQNSQLVVSTLMEQKLEVGAGVKQQLEADLKKTPGLRLLDGRFMAIHQAMGTPRGRPAAARYLAEFVEEMKATGFVAEALQRHRIEGALVAPAGR